MTSTSNRGLLAGLGVCLVLITTALFLLPAGLGGKPIFVTTHGTSMEPRFHTGDLAVLFPADSYHVGDVAAYHSSVLHTVVMHRIVKIANGRYTFKGDNNSWLDPAPAARSQLLGKLALRIPDGGLVMEKVISLAPFVIAGVLLLVGTGVATKRRRGRRSRHSNRGTGPSVGARRMSPDLATAAAITAVAAVFGVFLGIMGLTAPSATTADVRPHTGTAPAGARTAFSYSAHVGRTPAYDQTIVTAPAPIFRKVTNLVDLSASYTGRPGTLTLNADLSTPAGWHSTIALCPATTFTGSRITRTVQVDLRALDRRAQAAAVTTGIPADTMGIDVTATVAPNSGAPFTSVLHLTMTPLELSMIGSSAALVHESVPVPAPTAPTVARSSTVGLFGRQLPAGTALAIAGVVLAGCAVSAVALAARARWIAQGSEGDAIRRRYSALLVPVEPISAAAGRPLVDVPEMATLAKVAERYGLLVLHWSRAGVETFVVQDENTTYRYRAIGPASQSRSGGAHRSTSTPDVHDDLDQKSGTVLDAL